MKIDYGWFHTAPAHPKMKKFDKEIAWAAIPAATEVTLKELKNKEGFKPSPFSFKTKEEFFDCIEKLLREGIKRAGKPYRDDIYVVEKFPFSFGNLTIDDCLYGSGRIYLIQGRFMAYIDEEIFRSIPEEILTEFDLKYEHYPKHERPNYLVAADPEKPSNVWYIKDAYNEEYIFARNFTVAYVNEFLKENGL